MQTVIICLCIVIQLPVITPKQDGEVYTALIDAVGLLRFINLCLCYSVRNSDFCEKIYLYTMANQKERPCVVHFMSITMWTHKNFRELHSFIAESIDIFEWRLHFCRQSSVTSEKQHVLPPDKSCYPISAATYIYI